MRLDHSTAADPDGDLIVGEGAYLKQEVAYDEKVQRSRHNWSHGGEARARLNLSSSSQNANV